MPVQSLKFGDKLPGSGNMFLRIKEKGDQVQFRIAQEPVYTGKHFIQDETGWSVPECPRIANGEECDYCEKYFTLMGEIKKMKAADKSLTDESPEIKKLKTNARSFQTAIEFYFPILDRGDGKMKILQTTNGVRNKFNSQFEAGIDVLSTEWILRNTGSASPAERYMLAPVDSAKVQKFSPEEEEEFEKARTYDLSVISQQGGGEDSQSGEDFPDK